MKPADMIYVVKRDKDSCVSICRNPQGTKFRITMQEGPRCLSLLVKPGVIDAICRFFQHGQKYDLYFNVLEYATSHVGDVDTVVTKWNIHWNGVYFWFGINPKHPYGTYESFAGVDIETAQQIVTEVQAIKGKTFVYDKTIISTNVKKLIQQTKGTTRQHTPPDILVPKTLIDDLASWDKDEPPCDESLCRECKGTGKIVLFTSVVDCDCTKE